MRLPAVGLVMLVMLVGACAQAPRQEPAETAPLYFPSPPEVPRFVFERTIQGSVDLLSGDAAGGLRRALTGESVAGVSLVKPFDVSVCGGVVFVSDSVSRGVVAFDAPAGRVYEIGRREPGLVRKPLGLATDASCNLYVADATLRRVSIYAPGGDFIGAVGGQDWFERLSHVAVSGDGTRVYAVDTGGVSSDAHRVRVFDVASGAHLFDIGSRGEGRGQFNLPRDIAVGPEGNLYVVDGGNFRVQVLTADGAFVRQIGSLGRMYGQFARPKGIAVDAGGNVYVSDAAHGNFQIFDPDGQLLLFVGYRSETPTPAGYMLPAGIDVDADGRVYLIDQYHKKVDVFRPASLTATDGDLGIWGRSTGGG